MICIIACALAVGKKKKKTRDVSAGSLQVSNMAGIKFVPEGRASVYSFVLGLGAVCIPLLSAAGSDIAWVQTLLPGIRTKIAIAVYVASVNGLLLVLYKGPVYQVTPQILTPNTNTSFMFAF